MFMHGQEMVKRTGFCARQMRFMQAAITVFVGA